MNPQPAIARMMNANQSDVVIAKMTSPMPNTADAHMMMRPSPTTDSRCAK